LEEATMKRIKSKKPIHCGTVEGLDLLDKGVHKVQDIHHYVGRTSRSVSEAFKDADYAYAGSKPTSEWKDFVKFVSELIMISPVIFIALYILYIVIEVYKP